MSVSGRRPKGELSVLMVGAEPFNARPGGLNRYFEDLARSFRSHGHSVTSVTLNDYQANSADMAPSRAFSTITRTVRFGVRAIRVMRLADYVDAHFALYALIPFLLGRRSVVRVVHFHGPWALESRVAGGDSLAGWLKGAIERIVYRRAEIAITLSTSFARVLEGYGVSPQKIKVIPPGVDLTRFSVADRSHERARFGVHERDFLFVCARRLEPRMGIDLLIQAFVDVHRRHPRTRLIVAGEGSASEELRSMAHLLGGDSLSFTGRLSDDDLVSLYRAADCSVVPSRTLEGFGLVTLESFASGTPVIATDVGGLPDAVRPLDPSLVVASGDSKALAERMRRAAQGELPSRDACRAYAETFSWSAAVAMHEAVYAAFRRSSIFEA